MLTLPISGRLRAAAKNLVRLSARNWTSLPARSSRTNETPPAVPTPGIAGGEKLKTVPAGSCLEFLVQTRLNGLILFALASALIPGFQRYPEEGVIRGPDVAEQTETYDAGGVLDPRRVCEKFSTCLAAALVRSSDAALGSCILT